MDSEKSFQDTIDTFCIGKAQEDLMREKYLQTYHELVGLLNKYPDKVLEDAVSTYLDTAVHTACQQLLGIKNKNKVAAASKKLFLEEIKKLLTNEEINKYSIAVNIYGRAFYTVYLSKAIINLTDPNGGQHIFPVLRNIVDKCITECVQQRKENLH